MHHEFAIEPASITSDYRTFYQVIEKFGFEKGLLISAFPSKWKKEVMEHLNRNFSDINKSRAIDLLQKKTIVKSHREYNTDKSWLEATCDAHANKPFHAIIATDNVANHQDVITVHSVCHEECAELQIANEVEIFKTPNEYARLFKYLLIHSNEIMLIDPYCYARTHSTVLKEVLKVFDGKTLTIKYFIHAYPKNETLEHRKKELEKLNHIVPNGLTIEFVLLSDNADMHNRYIITDKGGIKMGSSMNENAQQTDEINLMSLITHSNVYTKYDQMPSECIVDKFTISGA